VRTGLVVLIVACLFLAETVAINLDKLEFSIGSALLGLGMGLIASQLGNVLQSSVENADRGEAGALQNTAQQLGSALGTAFVGAIVITALGIAFLDNVESDPAISENVSEQAGIAVGGGITFISTEEFSTAAEAAGLSGDELDALVSDYEDAQVRALKIGLLVAALLGLIGLTVTGGLPSQRQEPELAPAPA
jgi:MFS family permease